MSLVHYPIAMNRQPSSQLWTAFRTFRVGSAPICSTPALAQDGLPSPRRCVSWRETPNRGNIGVTATAERVSARAVSFRRNFTARRRRPFYTDCDANSRSPRPLGGREGAPFVPPSLLPCCSFHARHSLASTFSEAKSRLLPRHKNRFA